MIVSPRTVCTVDAELNSYRNVYFHKRMRYSAPFMVFINWDQPIRDQKYVGAGRPCHNHSHLCMSLWYVWYLHFSSWSSCMSVHTSFALVQFRLRLNRHIIYLIMAICCTHANLGWFHFVSCCHYMVCCILLHGSGGYMVDGPHDISWLLWAFIFTILLFTWSWIQWSVLVGTVVATVLWFVSLYGMIALS